MKKHISDQELLQFCETALDPMRAAQIQAHIDACAHCRQECEEIRLGISATRELTPEILSNEATERIKNNLRGQAQAQRHRKSMFADHRLRWALAIAAAYIVVSLLLQLKNPGAKLHAVSGPASEFEQVALSNYNRYIAGSLQFDIATSSPEKAQQWIREQGNFSAPLAVTRPAEDADRFQLQGLKRIPYDGNSALVITYRIDDHPVLLLTARSANVSNAPKAGLLSKSIYLRNRGSLNFLSWSTSGEVYSLVSDLPKSGLRSCFICHTDRAHRKKIEQAAGSL